MLRITDTESDVIDYLIDEQPERAREIVDSFDMQTLESFLNALNTATEYSERRLERLVNEQMRAKRAT